MLLCRSEDQLPELTALANAAAGLYAEWRRVHRAGLAQTQNSYVPVYERAAHIRFYQSSVIPSVFRTAEYARAIITAVAGSWELNDEVDAAVASSLTRSHYLHVPGRPSPSCWKNTSSGPAWPTTQPCQHNSANSSPR